MWVAIMTMHFRCNWDYSLFAVYRGSPHVSSVSEVAGRDAAAAQQEAAGGTDPRSPSTRL